MELGTVSRTCESSGLCGMDTPHGLHLPLGSATSYCFLGDAPVHSVSRGLSVSMALC